MFNIDAIYNELKSIENVTLEKSNSKINLFSEGRVGIKLFVNEDFIIAQRLFDHFYCETKKIKNNDNAMEQIENFINKIIIAIVCDSNCLKIIRRESKAEHINQFISEIPKIYSDLLGIEFYGVVYKKEPIYYQPIYSSILTNFMAKKYDDFIITCAKFQLQEESSELKNQKNYAIDKDNTYNWARRFIIKKSKPIYVDVYAEYAYPGNLFTNLAVLIADALTGDEIQENLSEEGCKNAIQILENGNYIDKNLIM